MASKEAYIVSIEIEEVSQREDKNGKPWWSVKTVDGEYYSTKDPMIVAQLAPGWKTVSVIDNQTGDKVFHNIAGIAPPQPVVAPDMNSLVPGSPAAPAAPITTADKLVKAPAAKPAAEVNMSAFEVRAKALELALQMPGVTQKSLASVRDAFYGYIVNGAQTEHNTSSEDFLNEFVAK